MNRSNHHHYSEVVSYTPDGEISKHAFIGVLPQIPEKQIFLLLRCKLNSTDVKLVEIANRFKRLGRPLTEDEQQELIDLASNTEKNEHENRRFVASYDYMMIEFKELLGSPVPVFHFSEIPKYSILAVSNLIRLLSEDPLAASNFNTAYTFFHKLASPNTNQDFMRFNFVEEYDDSTKEGLIRPRSWYKDALSNINSSMYNG